MLFRQRSAAKKGAGLLYKVLQRASENTIPLTHDWSGQSFSRNFKVIIDKSLQQVMIGKFLQHFIKKLKHIYIKF